MKRLAWSFLCFTVFSCNHQEEKKTLFVEKLAAETNITFVNKVTQSGDNNVLKYPYYFNGGGVAVGDINNDGLMDIYFSGNQTLNKLYLNEGNFKFKDITESAGVQADIGWKTGVTLADVNQDGWLDIYVCRSAMADSTLRKNLLFINNGNLTFTEKADALGVADPSYSTQGAFFDFDKDGDLDLFVLNHSLPKYAGLNRLLVNYKNQKSSRFGSKLFRNDGGKFSDISESAGIVNNVLSFGLGVAITDVNNDGWPDIYVSNDFNEEDYLYINQHDGTFKNTIREAMGHVSLFSMGSDAADINNDFKTDILTLDMLPESNERIKLSSGDDNYDKYRLLTEAGFHHQSMRNMLQLNNGDGTFSEIGQLAGVSNTDWSWSAFFCDLDLDGQKDLYVSNGYETDYTNMQFLKFTMDEQMKAQQSGKGIDVNRILQQMPSIETGNVLFKNNGGLSFEKKTADWGLSNKFKSNGATYTDLDNDGDVDLIINVMNGPAKLFENTTRKSARKNSIVVDLRSENLRQNIVGTKLFCYSEKIKQMLEFEPVRGFQSASYGNVIFGIDSAAQADSIRVVWPNDRTELIRNVKSNTVLKLSQTNAKGSYVYASANAKDLLTPVNALTWTHHAADTNDFKRQILVPKIFSYSGPKSAKGDVNGDGLEDVYLCGARHQPGALFKQKKDSQFEQVFVKDFEKDKQSQDEAAVFFDADKDGDLDLYVVSGGYLFGATDALLQDRLYINNGKGGFAKSSTALPKETNAGSCVQPIDIDGDGDLDLFVGSRLIPGQYPITPKSMLLINDGSGHFTNEIAQRAPTLESLGMICDAIAIDLDRDKRNELIVVGEWASVSVFAFADGNLVDRSASWFHDDNHGWWNCIAAADIDSDGDIDLVTGNFGLNNQFHVTPSQPATMVFKDFNNDNQIDPFFCYYIDGVAYPYASRDEALGQVSFLRPRFPDYTKYANKTLSEIFNPSELAGAITLTATTLQTTLWENQGNQFTPRKLPIEAQFSPVHAATFSDVDNDGDQDLLLGGNETYARVRIGKSDASHGDLFINDGKGNFSPANEGGLHILGDIRSILPVNDLVVVGVNNSAIKTFKYSKPK